MTKTVEELAQEFAGKLKISPTMELYPSHRYSDGSGKEITVESIFLAGYLACEQKLAAADGAYHLGIERASSRYRPVKIDPEDASTFPPINKSVLLYLESGTRQVGLLCDDHTWSFEDYAAPLYFVSHWLPIPEVEG